MAKEMEDHLDCGGCNKTLEEVIYWKHIKRLRFCAVLRPDFQDRLHIPKKFAENMKPNIFPPKITLRGPSGASWEVTLMSTVDGVFLQDGWEEFVQAHSLKENEILFFKYDRNSSFDVKIFNGQCERVAAYFVKKCSHVNPAVKNQKRRASTEIVVADNGNGEGVCNTTKKARSEVEYVSHRRNITEEEKDEAFRKAISELVDESFLIVLPASSCYKDFFVTIPAEYLASVIFRHKNEDIVLCVGVKKWIVGYCFTTGRLCSGWRQFALDNHLEESDVCFFKLVSQANAVAIVYNVTIFRVVEEITPLTIRRFAPPTP